MTTLPTIKLNKTHFYIKSSWKDFKKDFLFYVFLFLVYLVLSVSVSKIPFLGLVLGAWIITPVIRVGFGELIEARQKGETVEGQRFEFFLRGFKNLSNNFFEWIKLGLLEWLFYFGVILIGVLPVLGTLYFLFEKEMMIKMFLLPISMVAVASTGGSGTPEFQGMLNSFFETAGALFYSIPFWGWALMAIYALLAVQIFFYLYFASLMTPFAIHFKKRKVSEAYFVSIRWVFKNWFFFKWITFYYTLWFYVGIIFTLGLGFLFLVPLLTIFIPHIWYQELFQNTENEVLTSG